jgi:hypothetical protein
MKPRSSIVRHRQAPSSTTAAAAPVAGACNDSTVLATVTTMSGDWALEKPGSAGHSHPRHTYGGGAGGRIREEEQEAPGRCRPAALECSSYLGPRQWNGSCDLLEVLPPVSVTPVVFVVVRDTRKGRAGRTAL